MGRNRAYYWFVTVLVFCCIWPSTPLLTHAQQAVDYVPGEVLLRLVPGADIQAVARRHSLRAPTSGREQLNGRPVYRLRITDGSAVPRKSTELAGDTMVLYAEPNYIGQSPEARQRSSWAVGDDDGANAYQTQWAPEKLRLREAHAVTRGANITVAMLDTGVDLSHPALLGHLVSGYDFVDEDSDPAEVGTPRVDQSFGHGTHVAGLVALAAPDANLMPLRTLAPDGTGTIWNQVRALRFAVEHGATVINLSWSFPTRSRILDDILAEVTCATPVDAKCRTRARPGAAVVAAAGNSGTNVAEYPAASTLPGVMAVAASTQNDTLASFSTYGPWVTLAAPGEHIVSSVPGGTYACWSGTSMAVPLAAGIVALVRAVRPTDKPVEVVARLVTTGVSINGPVQRRINGAALVDQRP